MNTNLPVVAAAANGDTMAVAVVPAYPATPPSTLHILASTNGGNTWSDPVPVTPSDTNFASYSMDVTASGNWLLAYSKKQEGYPSGHVPSDIRVIRSTNPASAWTPSQTLAPGEYEEITFDRKNFVLNDNSSLAMDNTGGAVIIYEATVIENGTDYVLRTVRSTDFGATWSQPALFNSTAPRNSAEDWMLFQ